ncbi:MAG TPA: transcriptional regulator [Ruminococcaceae bacterium]|nr:transcriptional regulator [Oscillospiraceae bacterium]
MNLSNQLKKLRARDGLSQEALASRVYVTRQTVSNWETGKSYPDIHSLIALSVLFNVSLDELVKGDIEIMKNELDVYRMKLWSWIMILLIVAAIVIMWPLYVAFGVQGLIPSGILFALGFAVSVMLERIKKKHNVQAYTEIVAFLEGKPADKDKVPWERKHKGRATLLKLAGGAVAGLVLVALSYLIWTALLK